MAASEIGHWEELYSLWLKVRTCRARVNMDALWPPHNMVWGGGIIDGIADGTHVTLTDADGNPLVWDDTSTYSTPWTSTDSPYTENITTWRLVIHDCDPRKIITAEIDSWNASGTLTLDSNWSIDRRVTERVCLEHAELIGKTAYIIRGDGMWWHERILQWPNPPSWVTGTMTSATTASIIDTTRRWTVNEHAGRDAVYKDGTSEMRRSRITANTADTLTFATETWTPAGTYHVVAADAYWQWDRVGDKWQVWYTGNIGGEGHQYWTYSTGATSPDVLTNKPSTYFDEDHTTMDTYIDDPDPTFDNDNVTKSLRWIQIATKELYDSGKFLDPAVDMDEYASIGLPILEWPGGYPRYRTLQFVYLYPQCAFVPDIVADPEVDELHLPPTSDHPGQWREIAPSTNYREPSDGGIMLGTGTVTNGQLARYVGCNFSDPATLQTYNSDPMYSGGKPAITDYHGRWLFVGHRQAGVLPRTQQQIITVASGTITAGGNDYFTDDSQDLWGSVLRTESGTATGGSTTSLIDTGKAGNGFWANTRHQIGETPVGWVGFIIEVLIGAVWHKRPITSHTTTTLGWDVALPSTASGCDYRIREPGNYRLSEFAGRALRLVEPDGTVHDVGAVTAHDDETVFFPIQGFWVDAGWTWEIQEHQPGGTWLRSGGAWTKPTGTDTRGGRAYPSDQRAIVPHVVSGTPGNIRLDDVLCQPLFTEMHARLDKLTRTHQTIKFGDYRYGTWVEPYGEVSGGAAGTLTITGSTWETDFYIGTVIKFVDVDTFERYGVVTANTADTLTFILDPVHIGDEEDTSRWIPLDGQNLSAAYPPYNYDTAYAYDSPEFPLWDCLTNTGATYGAYAWAHWLKARATSSPFSWGVWGSNTTGEAAKVEAWAWVEVPSGQPCELSSPTVTFMAYGSADAADHIGIVDTYSTYYFDDSGGLVYHKWKTFSGADLTETTAGYGGLRRYRAQTVLGDISTVPPAPPPGVDSDPGPPMSNYLGWYPLATAAIIDW